MENADIEEVTLDMEAEADPEPQSAKVESDPAAEAFARLEGEMALMRRAVQHLAAERADIVIPNYGKTLGEMTKRLDAMSGSLDDIAEHPAMQVTPERLAARIEAVAVAARRADHERIDQASKAARQAAQDMKAAITHVCTAAEHRRRLLHGIGGGVLAGILLWSFLPGTIARAVPESWHWPERMAARMVGTRTVWEAGSRLMQTDNPQVWAALVSAAEMQRANRDVLKRCKTRAEATRRSVDCTIRVGS